MQVREREDGAGGHYLSAITVTNTSQAPCSVDGLPAIDVTRAGLPQPVAVERVLRDGSAVTLLPGHAAYAELWTPTQCAGDPAPVELQITVPGAGAFSAGEVHLEFGCSVTVSDFRGADAEQDLPAQGLDALQVSIDAPASVRAGDILAFTVRLTNPTPAAVSLMPCPSYRVLIATGGPDYVDRLLLVNCAAADSMIPARGSVTFAMRVDLPAAMRPGVAKFFWALESRSHPTAVAQLRVLSP